jgi:hypothetical protein
MKFLPRRYFRIDEINRLRKQGDFARPPCCHSASVSLAGAKKQNLKNPLSGLTDGELFTVEFLK